MSAYRPAILAAVLLFSLSGMANHVPAQEVTAESPSDSLAYAVKKRKILESRPDVRMAAVLEAADDLAQEGFHAEALELIHDLEDTARTRSAERSLEAELDRGLGAPPDSLLAAADSALAAAERALVAAEIVLARRDSLLAAATGLPAARDSALAATDGAAPGRSGDAGRGAASVRDSLLAASDAALAARDSALAGRNLAQAARDAALAARDSLREARYGRPEGPEDGGYGPGDAEPYGWAGPVPAAPAPRAERSAFPQFQSYVRSSLEYDDWDGSPVGGEVRAKLEWLPEDSFLERVTPTFAGSDRRGFAGLSARGSAFGRMLKASAEALAEKRMWQTYGDSLDRVSAHAVVEAGTRPLGKAVSVSLPVRFEAEQYRHDRLGLLSRRGLGASPAVEAVSADWRKSAMVAWEAQVFRFPSSPASDFVRQGPYVLANWYGDLITAEFEGQVMDDRYRRDTSMFSSRSWEGRLSAFVRALPSCKAGLRLHHHGEFSRYADSLRLLAQAPSDSQPAYRVESLAAAYSLEGSVTTLQPVLTVEWAAVYSASLSLAYSRGWYPLLGAYGGRELFPALFIDESFTSWKPEATFSVLSRKLFLNATAGYELHRPDASPHYYTGYHEVLGLGGNLSWKLGRSLELDFSGLFRAQTRGAAATAMDMTSLSAGITSRFQ